VEMNDGQGRGDEKREERNFPLAQPALAGPQRMLPTELQAIGQDFSALHLQFQRKLKKGKHFFFCGCKGCS